MRTSGVLALGVLSHAGTGEAGIAIKWFCCDKAAYGKALFLSSTTPLGYSKL